MHDRKMVLNNVEILLVVKVIEDDWKMEKNKVVPPSTIKDDLTDTFLLLCEDFR